MFRPFFMRLLFLSCSEHRLVPSLEHHLVFQELERLDLVQHYL